MASKDDREVVEGTQYQGEDEVISYTVDLANTASSPSGPSVTVFDVSSPGTFTDVESTVMPTNSPSFAGTVLTLSPLRSLTRNKKYRVEIQFTEAGNKLEHYFYVYGQR